MPLPQAPRRNADGSLDIDHYRRRARRLRHLARRQAWRRLRMMTAALPGWIVRRGAMVALRASAWAGVRRVVVMLACLAAVPVQAQPAPGGFIATPLLVERLASDVVRLYRLELGPGTETVTAAPPGREVVLVVDGAIIVETAGSALLLYRPGEVIWRQPREANLTCNALADRSVTVVVGSFSAAAD